MGVSQKSRIVNLLTGTRTEAGGIPSYETTTNLLVKDLTPRLLEGDYQTQNFFTGREGSQGDRLYNKTMGLEFMIDASTSGAAGTVPLYDDLIRATGWDSTIVADTSVSYSISPLGADKHQVAMQYRDAQSVQTTENMRGSLSFTADNNAPPMFGFNLMGKHFNSQQSVAQPVDFNGWRDAPSCEPENMETFTVNGVKLCVQSFSFSDGRTARRNQFMNCDETDITQRNITGRMVVEMPSIDTIDLLALAETTERVPLVWQMKNTPGDILRIAAPAVQIKFAGQQDIDGILGTAFDLVFTGDQGDDELAIIFE